MTAKAAAKDNPPIAPNTMRHLHVALAAHGMTTDTAVHDYLTTTLGREVTSRKDLTEAEAKGVIAELEEAPRGLTPAQLRALRRPFPENAVGKLPRSTCKDCSDNRGTCGRHPNKSRCSACGNWHSDSTMHLDYVGHADVTDRLLEVDPHWTWRPMTPAELAAVPPVFRDAGLWIMLTVAGVTRPGFGDADGKRGGNAVKEAIGDALRNGAMRFGVALDLWAKGDRQWAHAEKDDPNPSPDPTAHGSDTGPSAVELIDRLSELAIAQSTDLEGITAKFRQQHGGIPVEQLGGVSPHLLHGLVLSIEAYIAAQAKADA